MKIALNALSKGSLDANDVVPFPNRKLISIESSNGLFEFLFDAHHQSEYNLFPFDVKY